MFDGEVWVGFFGERARFRKWAASGEFYFGNSAPLKDEAK
jgi:hypothetical protein